MNPAFVFMASPVASHSLSFNCYGSNSNF